MLKRIFTESQFRDKCCLEGLREGELLLFTSPCGWFIGRLLFSFALIPECSFESVLIFLPRCMIAWLVSNVHTAFLTTSAVLMAEPPSPALCLDFVKLLPIFDFYQLPGLNSGSPLWKAWDCT